jgi:hypothetical protein
LNVFLKKAVPEGLDRKNFKIETQSTRSERRNNGYNVLANKKR